MNECGRPLPGAHFLPASGIAARGPDVAFAVDLTILEVDHLRRGILPGAAKETVVKRPFALAILLGWLLLGTVPAAFAAAIQTVLGSDDLRATLTANGLHHVQHDFTLQRQAERFVAWYREILARERSSEAHHAAV